MLECAGTRARPDIRRRESIGKGYCHCSARYRPKWGTVLEITDYKEYPLQSWLFRTDWPTLDIMEFRALVRLSALKKTGSATITPRDILMYLPQVVPVPRDRVLERVASNDPAWCGHWLLREPRTWASLPWFEWDEVIDRVAGMYDIEEWDAHDWVQKRDLRAKAMGDALRFMEGWDRLQEHRTAGRTAGPGRSGRASCGEPLWRGHRGLPRGPRRRGGFASGVDACHPWPSAVTGCRLVLHGPLETQLSLPSDRNRLSGGLTRGRPRMQGFTSRARTTPHLPSFAWSVLSTVGAPGAGLDFLRGVAPDC